MIEIEIMSVLQSIAELSFLAFIVLSFCGLILPTFLFWRVEALSLMALFVGFLIEDPTHHSNQNVNYVIGFFVVVFYIFAVLMLISARLIFLP